MTNFLIFTTLLLSILSCSKQIFKNSAETVRQFKRLHQELKSLAIYTHCCNFFREIKKDEHMRQKELSQSQKRKGYLLEAILYFLLAYMAFIEVFREWTILAINSFTNGLNNFGFMAVGLICIVLMKVGFYFRSQGLQLYKKWKFVS